MDEIKELLNKSEKIEKYYRKHGCILSLMELSSAIETLERYKKFKSLGPRQSKKYELIKDIITNIYTRLEEEGF